MVGCELEGFKEYYRRNEFAGEQGTGELVITEERIVTQDSAYLNVWRENNEIIGDVIWHETSTDEHRRGDPRDREDREVLRKLCGQCPLTVGANTNCINVEQIHKKIY